MVQNKEYYHQYYLKNKERIKLRTGEYQRNHRELSNRKSNEWAKKNPERIKEIQKKYADANKGEISKRQKIYYLLNRDDILLRNRGFARKHNLELKIKTLTYYGNDCCSCVSCGIDNIDCLSVDHINNNGSIHRKILGSNSIYRVLAKEGYPNGYQTLCMNCQWIKKAQSQRQRRLPSRL